MASVSLSGVQKRYPGGVCALGGIDLEVADGELVVLVGPSGGGKTTTLRVIAGLERADAGVVRIGGRAVDRAPPRDRDVAMVPQDHALYPHQTVRQNLAFGLKMRGVARAERERRAVEAAELLGVAGLLDRRPGELSGGERQRVALGRAIVREPAVFLLDEPLSNLDAPRRVEMRREIARLHRRLGATMLYVTHDQSEAMTLGQRVVLLRDGRVQQAGAPQEVYRRPANRFAATFLGSPPMNLVEGHVQGEAFVAEGVAWRVGAQASGATTLGARAEHVRFATGDAPVLATGVLVDVERLGHETLASYRLGRTDAVWAVRLPAGADAPDTAPLTIAPEAVHLFDASGDRIG